MKFVALMVQLSVPWPTVFQHILTEAYWMWHPKKHNIFHAYCRKSVGLVLLIYIEVIFHFCQISTTPIWLNCVGLQLVVLSLSKFEMV